MTKPDPDDLLTPSDAARLAGVSVDAIRINADKGNLPALRTTSGRRLFRRADVERFAAQRRTAA
jgi:excisionase family DNA binding protein